MVNEGHSPPPSSLLRTIFVDTSIGTHLGIVISLHDNISDVKAKIEAEHALCFQDIGDISIHAIKVRRRGFFYNLADSMYVMNAFDGVRGSWFICVDAVPIRPLKNQEVAMRKVTHEHLERHNSTVPVCSADKHQDIVSSGLSPKNQDAVMNKLLAQDWNRVMHNIPAEHENQMSLDASLEELVTEDGPSLQNRRISAAQNLQVLYVDELIPGDRNIKTSNKMKVNEAHLHEDMAISPEKNSGTDARESHNPISMSVDHEHRPELLIDRDKDGEKKKDCRDIGIESSDGMVSANCALQKTSGKRSKISQHIKLLESQSQYHLVEKKRVKKVKDGVHEEHYEDHRTGSKYRQSENINESIYDVKRETLSAASQVLPSKLPDEDTLLLQNSPAVKQNKRRKRKSSKSHEEVNLAMPSETLVAGSLEVITNTYNSGKDADASKYPTEANIDESLLNDDRDTNIAPDAAKLLGTASQIEKNGHSMEISMPVTSSINKESIEDQVLQVNPVVQSNTFSLQHSPVEKQRKKRKRKSSKFIAMSSETFVAQSPQVTTDQQHSGKEADASISLENYPTEADIDDSLPNDDRDMSIAPDAAKLIEIANQKGKTEHPMEICMADTSSIIESTEERIIQVNHVNKSELHVDLGQKTNVDVCIKEAEVSRISSLVVASQSPIKLYCSRDEFKSESSKVLEPKKSNDQQDMEFDAEKFTPESNLKEDDAGSIDARTAAPLTAKKFPYQGQATHATSKDSSGDKHLDSDKETDAAPYLKGANKDRSRGSRKTSKTEVQRSRKKSKSELSMICESTEVNGGSEPFNSYIAQVCLNDLQNKPDAAKFIKEADQKANGGHCLDTVDKSSSSSKKVLDQVKVSHMNSVIPLISLPPNMISVSNGFVEQAAESTVPSQPPSEFPAKPRRNRKKFKSELSNLGSQEITDVMWLKSNEEIKKSNEARSSDPSQLANGSNQTAQQYSIDSKVTVPLFNKDSSKQDEVPQVNTLDPTCSERQDLNEQSNAKVKTKEGDGTQILLHGALAGPTKSKHHRKKSKNAELKIQDSSEMGEHMGLCRPDVVGINFVDYFVSKAGRNRQDVPRTDFPSRKYEGSPTDLGQFALHKEHMVESQAQENDTTHQSLVDGEQDIATKDSKSGNISKAKNRKQSGKQKGHDKHKLEMKLQDYGPQSQVQLSKSGEESEQGTKITTNGKGEALSAALNQGIDNMVSKDECVQHRDLNSSNKSIIGSDALGSNHSDVSLSGGKAYMAGSSYSTEDTPHEIKRYRVVRKVPRKRSQKVSNNSNLEKSLLATSGRIFSDASSTCSENEGDPCKKNGITNTTSNGVPTTADSGMHLEEMSKKTSALKPLVNSHFSGVGFDERGEIGKEADDKTNDHSRSGASRQKMPLSTIFRSSSSYKKAKLTAAQSEFEDTESGPIDVVLETQLEPTP